LYYTRHFRDPLLSLFPQAVVQSLEGKMPVRKARKTTSTRRWSQRVTQSSNALDLDSNVFTWTNPKRIAASLKRSAEASKRRKASPLQSAMSMLNFYINRAGRGLPARQKRVLTQAKTELRTLFNK
jgi:hypothetical protein